MYGIGIGIGESDFKILRIKKDYYIDKTKYKIGRASCRERV